VPDILIDTEFIAIGLRERVRRVQVCILSHTDAESFNQFAAKPTAEQRRSDADKRQRER
jgi:hypothetical protein